MLKETLAAFYTRMVNEYQGVSRNDNSVLLCTYCNEQVTASKLFQVKQHIETAKHEAAAKRKEEGEKNKHC